MARRGRIRREIAAHEPSPAGAFPLGSGVCARGSGRNRAADLDLPLPADHPQLRRGARGADGPARPARRVVDLLLGPPVRRDAGGLARGAGLLALRNEPARIADGPDPSLRRRNVLHLARRAQNDRRAGRGGRGGRVLALASFRLPPVRARAGLLREQRSLLRAALAARAPNRRATRPRPGRTVRARLRARVLGDRANHSGRPRCDRLDDLETASMPSPPLGGRAARRPRGTAVAHLERPTQLGLAEPASRDRDLRARLPDSRVADHADDCRAPRPLHLAAARPAGGAHVAHLRRRSLPSSPTAPTSRAAGSTHFSIW